ncbi:hypothetical protein ON010_g9050 [Phytophthora cinnamomi]|nr:hypothetical protein ON010_g9050 [Phytophthora cinnamomi]
MRRTGHTTAARQSRLQVLMRTWGNNISRFPPSFLARVQRPGGRPPGVTRQLRAHAPQHSHANGFPGLHYNPIVLQALALNRLMLRTQTTAATVASTGYTLSAAAAIEPMESLHHLLLPPLL